MNAFPKCVSASVSSPAGNATRIKEDEGDVIELCDQFAAGGKEGRKEEDRLAWKERGRTLIRRPVNHRAE